MTKQYWIRTGREEEIYTEELHCPVCRCDVICTVITRGPLTCKEPRYCPNCGEFLADEEER